MKINLSIQSTKSLATLAQRLVSSSKNGKYKVVESQPLLSALEQVYNEYDLVYTKHSFSGKGKEVAAADEARDRAYTSLKNFLWGYQQLPIAPNAKAAEELYEVIKYFGTDIDRKNYAEETAQLKKLIEKLDDAEARAKLTSLGIAAAFDDLKAKQTLFEEVFAEQAEANADLRKVPSATAFRRGLERALRNYIDFVTAMRFVDGWQELYQELNELVKSARNS